MNTCYDASKSTVGKLSGKKQLPKTVDLVLSYTYTLSLVPQEYALVFFISTMFCLDLALPLKGGSIETFFKTGANVSHE